MAISGNAILLRVDTTGAGNWVSVGSQRGLDISRTTNVIDSSHKGDSHTQSLAGRRSGTITLDALYVPDDTAYNTLDAAYTAGTLASVRKYVSGVATVECSAVINDLSESHPDDDVSTISVGLTLNGDWTAV